MKTENQTPLFFKQLFENESQVISEGMADSIDETTNLPSLWLSLQHQQSLDQLIERSLSGLSTEPYNLLAGLLVSLLRRTLPTELHTQGLTIQTMDNTFRFCISGSISSDDLQKCLEQYIRSIHH
jgi:hypothetical protein